eukprot:CAMPEP_0180334632 /NCGR_PEP_ID=MMETSP0988-20121125/43796_1 /TAXON_ID=697907 /ORGANISM="non described non described, Strain CCMP2293" /LENGTH=54 /DNA_ID=CAMNT_0022322611 /DNA_START=14 /DNA_END=178 /DNA_ORIENTATION=+
MEPDGKRPSKKPRKSNKKDASSLAGAAAGVPESSHPPVDAPAPGGVDGEGKLGF